MKLQAISAILLGFALISVQALTLEKKASPSVVSFSFEKRHEGTRTRLSKRTQPISVQQNPEGILRYFVNYTLGTPPQSLYASLDTGSGNLIVFGLGLEPCASSVCEGGFYDPSASSTSKNLNIGFSGNLAAVTNTREDFIQIT